MKKDMRKESAIGLLILSMYLIAKRFLSISYFFSGLFMGLAISFIIVGILPEKLYLKLRERKIPAAK